ncbi:hypothetical protein DPMN_139314 [Dreissena polymorpha]|uniref:Uncharacterized protein n=1 Tax=Dreissena polymorpha TaxID=45954 RepID=A0A9D4G9A6_DREPO|nr:hypothetical protein DPMN_139314 [Dreissena polymorpha]
MFCLKRRPICGLMWSIRTLSRENCPFSIFGQWGSWELRSRRLKTTGRWPEFAPS